MNLQSITKSLKQAQQKTEKELSGINNALAALAPKKPSGVAGPRVLSAAARKRIGDAQRQRWKLVKKAAKAKLQLVKNGGRKAA